MAMIVLLFLTATGGLLAGPASAATDDQNLTGLVHLSDGTPLSATPWANNTSFAVYVNHGADWSTAWRYPAWPAWYLTSGGAYSLVLPAAQQNVSWANGDPYRMSFDASAIAGVPGTLDNATSHGTGDAGEISAAGATDNAIVWNMTDNWQRWDVVVLARPDLGIAASEVRAVPTSPAVGTPVAINATVRNLGSRDAADIAVRFMDGAPPAGTPIGADVTIPSLAVGASASVQTTWTAGPAGPHRLCAVADPDDVIPEENETNNVGCVDVVVTGAPPTRPDYVPRQPQPIPPVRTGLSSPLPLSLEVLNQGNASATATATLALYNGTVPGSPFATFAVPPLAPSASSSRSTATWTSPAAPGTYDVTADVDYADDLVEWNETNNRFTWSIDVLAGPVTTLVVGTPNFTAAMTYVTSSTALSFSVLDQSGAGIRNTTYRVDGGPWVNYTATGPFALAGEGTHVVAWFSEDNAGNLEAIANATLRVDDTPPATTIAVGEPKYVAATTYVTSSTLLTLATADGGVTPVGIASTEVRIDAGAWTAYASPFTLSGDGTYVVQFRSTDLLGNAESARAATFVVDDTPPVTAIAPTAGPYTPETAFVLNATDAASGVARTEYRVDGGSWVRYDGAFALALGDHVIGYRSADRLNNTEAERTFPVAVGGPPPPAATNWKPLVAALFATVLALVGAWSTRRAPWPTGSRRRLRAFALAPAPFIVAEATTGVVSLFTGLLAIPPLLGAGTAVDVAILAVGIAVSAYRVRKWKPPA